MCIRKRNEHLCDAFFGFCFAFVLIFYFLYFALLCLRWKKGHFTHLAPNAIHLKRVKALNGLHQQAIIFISMNEETQENTFFFFIHTAFNTQTQYDIRFKIRKICTIFSRKYTIWHDIRRTKRNEMLFVIIATCLLKQNHSNWPQKCFSTFYSFFKCECTDTKSHWPSIQLKNVAQTRYHISQKDWNRKPQKIHTCQR